MATELIGSLCLLLLAGAVVFWAKRRPQVPAVAEPVEPVRPLPRPVEPPEPAPSAFAGKSLIPSFVAPSSDENDSLTHVRPLPEDEERSVELVNDGTTVVHFEPGAEEAVDVEADRERIWTAAAGKTDQGIVRVRNEDAFLIDSDLCLYVVADGMGGYAKGDVASRLAVQEIASVLRASPPSASQGVPDNCPPRGRELIAAVRRANEVVHAEARQAGKGIIGTTLLAACFSRREQRVYIANVGDSRCYRLRSGELKLLTTDHTHAARGATGSKANDLYRAVGVAADVDVDLIVDEPKHGDRYLLCTDGLSRFVGEPEVSEILAKPTDLDRINSSLVLAANGKGGRDNVTVVTVAVSNASRPPPAP